MSARTVSRTGSAYFPLTAATSILLCKVQSRVDAMHTVTSAYSCSSSAFSLQGLLRQTRSH